LRKFKASELSIYFDKKGIIFLPRYISSKRLHHWVIRNQNKEYVYPFSDRYVNQSELDDMEFSENFLNLVFLKIMNLKDYRSVKISVEELKSEILNK
jgi:hypothetical protein